MRLFIYIAILIGIPLSVQADTYFNSSEPGCDGSDPTILWCDDIEDGSWIETCNATLNNSSACCRDDPTCVQNGYGLNNPNNDGWGGNIFTQWPDPQGTSWARCGGLGVGGTSCAATSGHLDNPDFSGQSSRVMGRKKFYPNNRTVREIFMRWYLKQLPGFQMGHEKFMTFENESSGYRPAIMSKKFNSGCLSMGNLVEDRWLDQNQGNRLCIQNDRWYYIEVRVKLDSNGTDGEYELWLDDCGADGRQCSNTPGTLRARHTGFSWGGAGKSFDTTWLENWGNVGSHGEQYYDQMIAATRRIGPMNGAGGDIIAPAAPQGLAILP